MIINNPSYTPILTPTASAAYTRTPRRQPQPDPRLRDLLTG